MTMVDPLKKIIEATSLRKTFGKFVAVNDINLNLFAGECLGLLGPNGAGKTSTIRMIYGFSPVTAGNLKVFGLDVQVYWRAIKFNIGVCQQENNLDPDLSVLQNLEVFARYFDIPRKVSHAKAIELLEFMGLEHRKDSTVMELSGGMMRRLVLARALINSPELLILDEPTTGLDPQSRNLVWDKLEQLRSNGLSILLTTHYMDEAARICDRLIIMDHGKILIQGEPSELIEKHAGQEVIEVFKPSQELREFVIEHHISHDDLQQRLILYGNKGDNLMESIKTRFCSDNCRLRTGNLEDVFLRLTGRDLRE